MPNSKEMDEPGEAVHVLHVDDEPDFAEMAAAFIKREDSRFEIETATSARDGLAHLASDEFDCIVSDYDMPGQNGIEFLEAVRDDYPDLPFILFTGKGSEEVASDAISAGVTDYLQKESGTDQYTILANRIRNAVERTRAKQDRQRIRERMELALEETNSVIFEFDFETGKISRHGAVESFFDIDPDKIASEQTYIERVVHPEDRTRVREFYRQLRTGETDYDEIEYRTNPDLGAVRWLRDHTYIEDNENEPTRVLGLARDITDKKERERELVQYEAYLQSSTDIITVLDASGTIKYESPSITRILGYDPGELIGENGFEYIHPDDQDEMWERFVALVDEPDATTTIECRFRTADGDWCWLEVRGTNKLEDPAINGIITNNRDITERKQQEQKRERIINRVTDAIVEVNDDWEFTLVNDQAEDVFAMTEADLLGETLWDVFSDAEGTRFEDEYRTVMETREPTSFTEYYTGLDSWFDITVYPKDNGGLAFYFLDVTDERERREELERRSQRFQYVEEVADIGYWEIDAQTPEPHEATLSDGVYRVHDLSPEEPFDVERGLEFYHPDDRAKLETAIDRALTDGEPYDIEARFTTAAGRDRWVHTVGEPVEEDGEIVKIRGVFQDITKRKQHEQELTRQNQRLDKFASIVSHDLQNPLNVASGHLEFAQDDCDSDHLDTAQYAIERSQRLIDDLLSLARQNEELGEREAINLAEIAQECWQNVPTTDAALEVTTTKDVHADPGRFRQLLENLFANAIEHGGETVTVTVGETADGFYVADDGPGIPVEERDTVFETGVTTETTNTGFGLAIVEQIVQAHDWEISVTDSEDGGARFDITLHTTEAAKE